MARPLRLAVAGGVYHVFSRGIEKRAIFETRRDATIFLSLLEQTIERYGWRCLTYCLMGNHYHLLVQTPDANLSEGMRHLNSVYAQDFNRRHERCGPLLQGRFRGELVETGEYLRHVAAYIARNPIRHGFATSAEQWEWSAHGAILGASRSKIVAVDRLLAHFGGSAAAALDAYRRRVEDPGADELPETDNATRGSDDFRDRHLPVRADARDEIPARYWQRPRPPLDEIVSAHEDPVAAAVMAHREFGYTRSEIARAVQRNRATVSRWLTAHEARPM